MKPHYLIVLLLCFGGLLLPSQAVEGQATAVIAEYALPPREQTLLRSSNPNISDLFGQSVALDGHTIVVGAQGAGVAGAAYVFEYDGSTWIEQAILYPSDPDTGDSFGLSVAIFGNTIVVGAFRDDGVNNALEDAGVAYVFVRDAQTGAWTEQAILRASNAGASDFFGRAVAISNATIVVGAHNEDGATNSFFNAGAAYVFVRDAQTGAWTEQAILRASNTQSSDFFGIAVAVDADTVVVGAAGEAGAENTLASAGAAYVFIRDPQTATWSEQTILRASNAGDADQFGTRVAIDGDTIAISAPYYEDDFVFAPNDIGLVYIFERDIAANWYEAGLLRTAQAQTADSVGLALDLDGDRLIVGTHLEDGPNNSMSDSGESYLFGRVDGAWTQQLTLRASNAESGDQFGVSVAISGDMAVIGAYSEDGIDNALPSAGAAYVFAGIRNQPPTASAGIDQTLPTKTQVLLDASASSDPDADLLSYAWTQTGGPNVSLTNPMSVTTSFIAPNDPAILTFTLTVSDTFNNMATDDVVITVENQAPSAFAGADQTVFPMASVTLLGSGLDPDDDMLSYAWVQTSGTPVTLTNPLSATATFVAPAAAGVLTFNLTVSDAFDASSSDEVAVHVINYQVFLPIVRR